MRRLPVLLATCVLVVAVAACGEASEQGAGETSSTTAPASTSTTTDERTCARTMFPIDSELDAYRYTNPQGPSLDYPNTPDPQTSVDGSMMRNEGATVVIERPEGVVTLARDGGTIFLANGGFARGDLDGDGHVDVLVFGYVGPEPDDVFYVIPGDLPPGTYDPSDVGVQVPGQTLAQGFYPVGDQDGDGGEDLALGGRLYSGRDLLDGEPGATIEAPEAFRTVENLAGVLQLDDTELPTLVALDSWQGPPSVRQLRVLGDEVLCLKTEDVPTEGSPTATMAEDPSGVHGWLVDGHRVVQLEFSNRSGTTYYRWDLDAAE